MIQVNDSGWPIVRLAFVGAVSLSDIENLEKELLAVHARSGPFVIVSDLAQLSPGSVTARIRQAIAQAADRLAERGALRGEAIIVPNPILRALYTGYSWLRSAQTHAQETFPDFVSAELWAGQVADKIRTSRSSA